MDESKSANKVYPNSKNVTKLEFSDGQTNIQTEQEHTVSTWRKFLVGPIAFVSVMAFCISNFSLLLYWTPYFRETLYPNETVTTNDADLTSPCKVNKSTEAYQHNLIIQAEVSKMNIYLAIASGIPAFFSNILYGAFSDHSGRKSILVIPIVGNCIKSVLCAIGMHYKFNRFIFLAFSIIEGVSGSLSNILQVSFSYVADITSKHHMRSLGIAVIEISAGLGMVIGSIVNGYMVQFFGFVWSMALSSGLSVLAIIAIICVLPETVNIQKKQQLLQCSNIVKYVKSGFSFYIKQNADGSRWKYILCLLAFVFLCLAFLGLSVETLYQIGSPFCWSPRKVGWYVAAEGSIQNVVGVGLIRLFKNFFSDEFIAIIGTVTSVASFTLEGLAKNDLTLYFVPVVGFANILTFPMIRAIMSKMTPAGKQGALFGGIAAVQTASAFIANATTNAIYANTVYIMKGFVFFVLAVFCSIASALLITLWIFHVRQHSRTYDVDKVQKRNSKY